MDNLSFDALHALLDSVFALQSEERWLSILVDLPDARVPDHEAWADRRRIAAEWHEQLSEHAARLPFTSVALCVYPNVGSNNNDLPDTATRVTGMAAYSLERSSGSDSPAASASLTCSNSSRLSSQRRRYSPTGMR